jgi:hypothetical protein
VGGFLERRLYVNSVSLTNLILPSVYLPRIVRSVKANWFVFTSVVDCRRRISFVISLGVYHHQYVATYLGRTTSLVAHYQIIELRLFLPVSAFHILVPMAIEPSVLLSS